MALSAVALTETLGDFSSAGSVLAPGGNQTQTGGAQTGRAGVYQISRRNFPALQQNDIGVPSAPPAAAHSVWGGDDDSGSSSQDEEEIARLEAAIAGISLDDARRTLPGVYQNTTRNAVRANDSSNNAATRAASSAVGSAAAGCALPHIHQNSTRDTAIRAHDSRAQAAAVSTAAAAAAALPTAAQQLSATSLFSPARNSRPSAARRTEYNAVRHGATSHFSQAMVSSHRMAAEEVQAHPRHARDLQKRSRDHRDRSPAPAPSKSKHNKDGQSNGSHIQHNHRRAQALHDPSQFGLATAHTGASSRLKIAERSPHKLSSSDRNRTRVGAHGKESVRPRVHHTRTAALLNVPSESLNIHIQINRSSSTHCNVTLQAR